MKKEQQRFGHLFNNVPNNFFTRWLVDKANQRMRKSQSLFRLQKRYRRPREGFCYTSFGGIVQKGFDYRTGDKMPPAHKRAKAFSLYLRNR